ncbi:MAG: SPOR domain-containing protein [Gammaproteobacteria bacterium]|nr:SPOR domain-containing protein [Gammaproteobacteria bacterium]MDP2142218.1 SPOR domain-containing protein [Gammaproteobacteria bacterium]MDP2347867.1 SPOR domain-containing protein [Gammaproteobacteria bacterium]
MRGILFGLLFSNLLYLGWGFMVGQRQSELVDAEQALSAKRDILLVSEAMPEELRYYPMQVLGSSVALPLFDSTTVITPAVEYCAEIGPFESPADADGFIGANASRFTMSSEVRRIPIAPDYRVYVPPFASRELATSTMAAIREAFAANNLMIDSFLIARGDLANGIALGLFTEQRNALNVQAQLEKLGYRVVIAEEEKFREELWVLVSGIESEAAFALHWAEIQLPKTYIQAGEKLCETIAHGLQFP